MSDENVIEVFTQCQVCRNHGVGLFDICDVCGWENDFSLEDDEGHMHDVGCVLTAEQDCWYSCANGSSPADHRNATPAARDWNG